MNTISIPRVKAEDTDTVAACLASAGALLLTGLHDRHTVLSAARSLGRIVPHRDSDADGITVIADRPMIAGAGLAGFSSAALAPHTDRSGVAVPPPLLLLACRTPAVRGGACVLVDG
ncbi:MULTISPECIES: TauD/TfdA family dioxygenase [Actinoalloteichus]|uniref:Taurine catabolism dioxygenase TauD, TfdA family n=1 Tax=Actinoalloteichus fjordicus TaxID=1612552 RepID=A0AAC9LEE7_9PSEU|nr:MULTISPECIES: TauD/TfdA family dioxygenase [Actinoalloteichus]APU16428.1 Taurine catabolism dioxygenase TauD, TfdA family [Actinoalloteichus fjordicus]APU22486.1 Taurine catabolism dioxygenase TauD, TfdA family [Actinoalloteichus sp. GBA129-24]